MVQAARALSAGAGGRVPAPLLECLAQVDHREAVVLEEALHPRLRGGVSLIGDRWVVILNARDSRRRARFTLAHEIGHLVLGGGEGSGGRPACGDRDGAREQERLCDLFAAELLLPAAAVRAAWPECGSVEELAERFDVSRAAAAARVRRLGLWV